MASRNGLNPKIRGQKGVGFNRALPAAFGFDRSYKPTNTGYLSIPRLLGTTLPMVFTLEFWTKPLNNLSAFTGYFALGDSTGNLISGQTGSGNTLQFAVPNGGSNNSNALLLNSWNHVVIRVNVPTLTYYIIQDGNVASPLTKVMTGTFTPAAISIAKINSNNVSSGSLPIDEFRLYRRLISDDEIITNYNSRIGANASITEGLAFWFKFEKIETLDFSDLQDGSIMQNGVRDISGENNHALINGTMDTNPVSPTYIFQQI